MKRFRMVYISFLVVMLLMPGCAPGGEETLGTHPALDEEREDVTLWLDFGQPVEAADEEARAEKLGRIVQEASLRIHVEIGTGEKVDEEMLKAMEKPNTAAIVREATYRVLADGNQLEDFRTRAWEIAPQYMQSVQDALGLEDDGLLPQDRIELMPGESGFYPHTAILVRRDIDEAFAREVESIEDYVALLRFAAQQFPQYKPGLVLPYTSSGVALYDILLADGGMTPFMTDHNLALNPKGEVVALDKTPYWADFVGLLEGCRRMVWRSSPMTMTWAKGRSTAWRSMRY